jgi:type I restriction enzyme M protein
VQQLILDSDKFKKYAADVNAKVDDWFAAHCPALAAVGANSQPNALIAVLGDDLLTRFKPVPLVDAYDVYEQLMTYWHNTIHDDVFMVMNDGWVEAAKPRMTIVDKDRKLTEEPDLTIGSGKNATKYKMDLVPPALIVARYFSDQQANVEKLIAATEEASRAVEEYIEEHAVEEGLLWSAIDDKDKVTQKSVNAALKEAKASHDTDAEKALTKALQLLKDEAAAKKAVKEAQGALDIATLKRYGDLTEADVKTIVLDDKWHATVRARIDTVVNALTHALVARIQELGERYAQTVGDLDASLADIDAKAARHLADMGVK